MNARAHPFILVAGGCRSGKSAFAQRLLEHLAPRRMYVATADLGAADADMARRVAAHRRARDDTWTTVETPMGRRPLWPDPLPEDSGLLFDCLGVWTAGCLEARNGDEQAVAADIRACLAGLRALPRPVVVVTTEVGLGVVPANRQARVFRDCVGSAAQRAAALADTVLFLFCGLPVVLKGALPAGFNLCSPLPCGE